MSLSIKIIVDHDGGKIEIDWNDAIDLYKYNDDAQGYMPDVLEKLQKECQRSVKILQGRDVE